MPSSRTFSVKPIGEFVQRYLTTSKVSVDPFARNCPWATWRNDLDIGTDAAYHMDAEDFLPMLLEKGIKADLAIFDPPYSPRQIADAYGGTKPGREVTQNAAFYKRVREALLPILTDDAIVLSFGWNSVGMGKELGFVPLEYLLVAHGGAHNDTICVAEQRHGR